MGFFWNRKPPALPPLWEYQIYRKPFSGMSEHHFTDMGRVGWELVGAWENKLIFKRPLPEHRRQTDRWLLDEREKEQERNEAFIREMEAEAGEIVEDSTPAQIGENPK